MLRSQVSETRRSGRGAPIDPRLLTVSIALQGGRLGSLVKRVDVTILAILGDASRVRAGLKPVKMG